MIKTPTLSKGSKLKLAKHDSLRAEGWLMPTEAAELHGIRVEAFLHRAGNRETAIGRPAVVVRLRSDGRVVRCSLFSPEQIRALTRDFVPCKRGSSKPLKSREDLQERFGYNTVPESALLDYVPFEDVLVRKGVSCEALLSERVFRVFGLLVPEDIVYCDTTTDRNPWIGPRLLRVLLERKRLNKRSIVEKPVDTSFKYAILNGELVIQGL